MKVGNLIFALTQFDADKEVFVGDLNSFSADADIISVQESDTRDKNGRKKEVIIVMECAPN